MDPAQHAIGLGGVAQHRLGDLGREAQVFWQQLLGNPDEVSFKVSDGKDLFGPEADRRTVLLGQVENLALAPRSQARRSPLASSGA